MPTTHKRRSHGRVIGRRCQRYSPAKTRYERWTARDKKRPMPSLLAVALVESVRFPLVEGLRFDKVAPPQFGREQKKRHSEVEMQMRWGLKREANENEEEARTKKKGAGVGGGRWT